jgi:DNA-binding protein H-NS
MAEATHDTGQIGDSADPAAALSPRERAAVIHKIRMMMAFWGITPEELDAPVDPADAVCEPPAVPLPVKYRHPATGDTWDGSGAHPQWLRDALLKEGFTVDQLRAAAAAAVLE